ncbi:MAG: hypothetical protein FWJ93_10030, partial [Micromonosporaceae bacterium]
MLIASVLLATACGSAFEKGGEPQGKGAQDLPSGNCQLEEGQVRIGVTGAMSGAHAYYGEQIKRGATM